MKNKAILVSITRKRKWTFDQRENEAIQNTQVFTLAKKKRLGCYFLFIQYTKLVAIFTLTSKSIQLCLSNKKWSH